MTLTKTTIKLCTFCYKSVPDDYKNKGNKVNQFCELLRRFVSDYRLKTSNVSMCASLLECCKDCEYLVNEFCEVYHQIKCLELQLYFKLKTLEEVMKMADRVPARLKLVKQFFEGDAFLQKQPHQEVLNADGQKKLTIFKRVRMEILRNCKTFGIFHMNAYFIQILNSFIKRSLTCNSFILLHRSERSSYVNDATKGYFAKND